MTRPKKVLVTFAFAAAVAAGTAVPAMADHHATVTPADAPQDAHADSVALVFTPQDAHADSSDLVLSPEDHHVS
ncbi:hypothetical protein IHE55_11060 [Streptomyces pactum]|uniref:CopC domain-containing protein n=1 Tax=Streptomyces pactum TaxID=68249 RepID=A0ABS0NJC5_9ACTN|nr:hypothetical protein [Streptomyces pactum]MBH5335302.1 hypothetical protein [Streptomyces pactum]